MGNRQRIIDATVELMNKNGSVVGTTQLVEHLSISPGNLYYHFRNREEILLEVLVHLQNDLDDVLMLEPGEIPDANRLASVLIGGAKVLWQYRFFFSSSLELVTKDPLLLANYQQFCARGTSQVDAILAGILNSPAGAIKLNKTQRAGLAETLWVLWTSWPRYIETLAGNKEAEQEMLRNHKSIEFVLKPYLTDDFFQSVIRKTRRLQRLSP